MPADSLGIRGSVDIDVRGAQQSLKQLDQSVGGFSKRSVAAFGAIGAGIFALNKAGRGLATVVQGWAGVDQVMSVVGTKMGATSDQLAALRAEVRRVGLETTKTADESAEALDIMATAGLNADQALGSLAATVQFAEATGHDMAASVKIASGALNVFKLEAEQLPKALNAIAGASNSSATTVGELGFALETSQGTWAETGDSLDTLLGALGVLANVGTTGAKAGTLLARAVTELRVAKTPEAAKALADLGVAAFDMEGNTRGASDMIRDLIMSLDGMTDAQKSATLSTIFGGHAMKAILPLVNAGADAIDDMVQKQKEAAGVTELSAARMNTLGGAFAEIEGTIITVLQNGFEPFAPLLHKATMGLSAFIKTISRVAQPVLNRFAAIMIGLTELSGADLRNSIMGWLNAVRTALTDGIKELGRDIQRQWSRTITNLFGARSIDHRALLNSMAGGMQILISEAVDNLQGMLAGFGDQVRDMLTSALDWTGLPTIMDSLASFFRVPANLGQSMSDAFRTALGGFVPEDVFDLDRRFAFLKNIRLPRLDFGRVEAEPPSIDTTNWLPGMTAPLTSVWDDTTNTFAGYLRKMGILGEGGNVIWQELGSRFWSGLTNIFSNVGQIFQGMGPAYEQALQQVAADSMAADPIIYAHTQAMGEIQRSMDELDKLSPGGHGDFTADLQSNMQGLQNTIQDRVAFLGGPSLANKVQAAFAVIGQAFTQGWDLLTDTLENSEAVDFLKGYATSAWDWLTDWMDGVPGLEEISAIFTGIGGAISAGWTALSSTFAQDQPDLGAITASFNAIRAALKAGWQSLSGFWQEGSEGDGRGASNIWADVMVGQDTSLAGGIKTAFAQINQALMDAAQGVWDGVLDRIKTLAQPVLDWWNGLGTLADIVLPGISESDTWTPVAAILDTLGSDLFEAWQKVKDLTGIDLPDWSGSITWAAVSTVVSGLKNIVTGVWDTVTGLTDIDLPDWKESTTWDVVSGALKAVADVVVAAWDAITGLTAANLPDISLPSLDFTSLATTAGSLLAEDGPLYSLKAAWGTVQDLTGIDLPDWTESATWATVSAAVKSLGDVIVGTWDAITGLTSTTLPDVGIAGLDFTSLSTDVGNLTSEDGPLNKLKSEWANMSGLLPVTLPDLDSVAFQLDVNTTVGESGPLGRLKAGWDKATDLATAVLPSVDSTAFNNAVDTLTAEASPIYRLVRAWRKVMDLGPASLPELDMVAFRLDANTATGNTGPIKRLSDGWTDVTGLATPTLPDLNSTDFQASVTTVTGEQGAIATLKNAWAGMSTSLTAIALPAVDASGVVEGLSEELATGVETEMADPTMQQRIETATNTGLTTGIAAGAALAPRSLKVAAVIAAGTLVAEVGRAIVAGMPQEMRNSLETSFNSLRDTITSSDINVNTLRMSMASLTSNLGKAISGGLSDALSTLGTLIKNLWNLAVAEVQDSLDSLDKVNITAEDAINLQDPGEEQNRWFSEWAGKVVAQLNLSVIPRLLIAAAEIGSFFRKLAPAIILGGLPETGPAWNAFTESNQAEIDKFKATLADDLGDASLAELPFFELLQRRIQQPGQEVRDLWTEVGDEIGAAFTQGFQNAFSLTGDVFEAASTAVGGFFTGLWADVIDGFTSEWWTANLFSPFGASLSGALPTLAMAAQELELGSKLTEFVGNGLGKAIETMTSQWWRNSFLFDLWDALVEAVKSFTTLKYEFDFGQRLADTVKGGLKQALDFLTPAWLKENWFTKLWDRLFGEDEQTGMGGAGGGIPGVGTMNVLRPGQYGGRDQGVQRMYGDDGFGGLDLPGLKGLHAGSALAAMRTGAGPGPLGGDENPMLDEVQAAMKEVAEYIEQWGTEEDILGKMQANLSDPINEALNAMIENGIQRFTDFTETLVGDDGLIPKLMGRMLAEWSAMFGVGENEGAEGSLASLLATFSSYNDSMTSRVVAGWQQVASAVISTVQSIESAINDLMQQYIRALRLQQAIRRAITQADPNYGTFSGPVVGRAAGGMVMKHEYTMVGERGPELVRLPAGSRVYPTGQAPGNTTNNTEYNVTVVKQPGEDTVDSFRRDMQFRRFASAGA